MNTKRTNAQDSGDLEKGNIIFCLPSLMPVRLFCNPSQQPVTILQLLRELIKTHQTLFATKISLLFYFIRINDPIYSHLNYIARLLIRYLQLL